MGDDRHTNLATISKAAAAVVTPGGGFHAPQRSNMVPSSVAAGPKPIAAPSTLLPFLRLWAQSAGGTWRDQMWPALSEGMGNVMAGPRPSRVYPLPSMEKQQGLATIMKAAAAIDRMLAVEAKRVNTSPTDPQKDAGNYQKGHVRMHGLEVSIENPDGSYRSGMDSKGKRWESKLHGHYGYIRGTKGADKEHLDVFVGPNPKSELIFVVDQVDPVSGAFDEHKCVFGCDTREEARDLYMKNYQRGWQGFGNITALTLEQFKEWIGKGVRKHPLSESVPEFKKAAGLELPEDPAVQKRKQTLKWLGLMSFLGALGAGGAYAAHRFRSPTSAAPAAGSPPLAPHQGTHPAPAAASSATDIPMLTERGQERRALAAAFPGATQGQLQALPQFLADSQVDLSGSQYTRDLEGSLDAMNTPIHVPPQLLSSLSQASGGGMWGADDPQLNTADQGVNRAGPDIPRDPIDAKARMLLASSYAPDKLQRATEMYGGGARQAAELMRDAPAHNAVDHALKALPRVAASSLIYGPTAKNAISGMLVAPTLAAGLTSSVLPVGATMGVGTLGAAAGYGGYEALHSAVPEGMEQSTPVLKPMGAAIGGYTAGAKLTGSALSRIPVLAGLASKVSPMGKRIPAFMLGLEALDAANVMGRNEQGQWNRNIAQNTSGNLDRMLDASRTPGAGGYENFRRNTAFGMLHPLQSLMTIARGAGDTLGELSGGTSRSIMDGNDRDNQRLVEQAYGAYKAGRTDYPSYQKTVQNLGRATFSWPGAAPWSARMNQQRAQAWAQRMTQPEMSAGGAQQPGPFDRWQM